MTHKNEIIIYDTEYWTDQGALQRHWSGQHDYPPLLIQIGAFKLKLEADWPVTEEFLAYVHPVDAFGKNAPITEYFTDLTNITSEDIKHKGESLEMVIQKFSVFTGERYMYSYGNDMIKTIVPSCYLNQISCPFNPRQSLNIKSMLGRAGMSEEELQNNTSGTLASHFGIKLSDHHVHDARADAKSIVMALRYLHNKGNLKEEWLLNPEQ